MAMKSVVSIILIVGCIFTATPSQAWLIYYKPELKGTILDIDTKQPIEGAVVVVEYWKGTIGLGAGTIDSIVKVRETLTGKDGSFSFPSYTRLIQPFSWKIPASFIIFKPGYASVEINDLALFADQTQELDLIIPWAKGLLFKVRGHGVVEIPKVRSKEERRKATIVGVGPGFEDKTPMLNKLRKEEDKADYEK
jgi:hypothetical protein